MNQTIKIEPLSAQAFAPFGDVISSDGDPDFLINQGKCGRHHDLAKLDFIGESGRANISIADSQGYELPLNLVMLERHPLGSQAFIPMSDRPFLVVVARDKSGAPDGIQAFLTNGTQGVNYFRNTWHGVLTPLDHPQQFVIVDRTGPGDNLEEHLLPETVLVTK